MGVVNSYWEQKRLQVERVWYSLYVCRTLDFTKGFIGTINVGVTVFVNPVRNPKDEKKAIANIYMMVSRLSYLIEL